MAELKLKNTAVAIFDDPEDCCVCPCANLYDEWCELEGRELDEGDTYYGMPGYGKPDWCPLKIVKYKLKFEEV